MLSSPWPSRNEDSCVVGEASPTIEVITVVIAAMILVYISSNNGCTNASTSLWSLSKE